MNWSVVSLWWIAAGIAVAAELATGSFYLLMIALGLAAGAIAAWLGLTAAAQVVLAALVGSGGTALLHRHRYKQPSSLPAPENRDVNLDIGEEVDVPAWHIDRTARVAYRGSEWNVRLAAEFAAAAGPHHVVAVEGNWLVLAPVNSVAATRF